MIVADYVLYGLCCLVVLVLAMIGALCVVAFIALVIEIIRWAAGYGDADEESC